MKYLFTILTLLIISLNYGQENTLVNQLAPGFTLTDEQGISHDLANYIGQDVVVYFYPKDDTPGCVKEACSIRDSHDIFKENNIMVFGISYDNAKSHLKFKEKYDLPFTLLSDLDKSVAKSYGSAGFLVPKRKTFLIDKQGIIFKIYESVDVSNHAQEILQDFAEYQASHKP